MKLPQLTQTLFSKIANFYASLHKDATTEDFLTKIVYESTELSKNPRDLSLYASVLSSLITSAHKTGFSLEDILLSLDTKMHSDEAQRPRRSNNRNRMIHTHFRMF